VEYDKKWTVTGDGKWQCRDYRDEYGRVNPITYFAEIPSVGSTSDVQKFYGGN
jgi:hypothetical protein